MISLFKILKNENLSTFWKGFRVNPMELLESDSMPWNFSRCPDRRETFGEMLKSETVEMLERLKRWNPLDWS